MVNVAEGFGRHLIGRDIGLEIRKRYFLGLPASWPAGLDMTGVEQATESCVDELLGTLAREHGVTSVERLSIVGASRPVRETIDYVLAIAAQPPASLSPEAIRGLLVPEKKTPHPSRAPRRRSRTR
jgi:hypothetical protein